jgi:hypothetical protein
MEDVKYSSAVMENICSQTLVQLKIEMNPKETKTEERLYLKFHGSHHAWVNKFRAYAGVPIGK